MVCYPINNTCMVKISRAACGPFMLFLILMIAGCANNVVNPTLADAAMAAQKPKQQIVMVNKSRAAKGQYVANQKTLRRMPGQSQAEYDKKRLWYNQQWLAKQQAEERQRLLRLKYLRRYEKKLLQAQAQKRQQRQQAAASSTSPNKYQQRQAQIEARQQQSNWQQDGRWQQQIQPKRASRVSPERLRRNLAHQLSAAAIARTYQKVRYDGRYIPIAYPMGDVPANIGVCTDTLIRSYRRLGIDLQRLVHEDIARNFYAYPNLPKWGLSSPDPNIDHRRVHNLKVFFSRNGQRLPITNNPADYRPGDIVTWHLGGDQEHIGLVVNRRSPADPRRYMIVHNIAHGDRMEDVLFKLPITGHYRYLPDRSRWLASR